MSPKVARWSSHLVLLANSSTVFSGVILMLADQMNELILVAIC